MRIKVDITRQDIRKGAPGWPSRCGAGLALTRALTTATGLATIRASVFHSDCHIFTDDGVDYESLGYAKTPKKVSKWIKKFDHNKSSVKPMRFTIEV